MLPCIFVLLVVSMCLHVYVCKRVSLCVCVFVCVSLYVAVRRRTACARGHATSARSRQTSDRIGLAEREYTAGSPQSMPSTFKLARLEMYVHGWAEREIVGDITISG